MNGGKCLNVPKWQQLTQGVNGRKVKMLVQPKYEYTCIWFQSIRSDNSVYNSVNVAADSNNSPWYVPVLSCSPKDR